MAHPEPARLCQRLAVEFERPGGIALVQLEAKISATGHRESDKAVRLGQLEGPARQGACLVAPTYLSEEHPTPHEQCHHHVDQVEPLGIPHVAIDQGEGGLDILVQGIRAAHSAR